MAETALFAIIPVVPIYVDQFDLSKLQAGALVSASAIAVTIVSIPAGLMSDRVGAKRMTIISACLLTASAFGQAFADSFVTVLAMRIVYGFGSSAVWTSGLSWLSDISDDESRSSTVGATATVAGVGSLVGPLFAGYTAEQFSVEAAFLVIGVATAVATLALFFVPRGVSHVSESPAVAQSLGLVRRNPRIIAALVLMGVGGFVDGFVNLLAPLELTADGLSSTGTGLVFSIASGLFIIASWLVTRSPRLATLKDHGVQRADPGGDVRARIDLARSGVGDVHGNRARAHEWGALHRRDAGGGRRRAQCGPGHGDRLGHRGHHVGSHEPDQLAAGRRDRR